MNLDRRHRKLRQTVKRNVNNPNVPLSVALDNECMANALGVSGNDSGVSVNDRTALQYSVVWKAHNLISGDVAKLPLNVFRRVDGGKEKAPDHPAYNLLRYKPNDCMTAYDFWKAMIHQALGGDGFALIERDGTRRPIALHLMSRDDTTVRKGTHGLWYEFKGMANWVHSRDVLHIKGLGFDGVRGYSVISYASRSIGEAIATQKYSAGYFKNNATPGVVLETDAALDDIAIGRLKKSWDAAFQGVKNNHKTAVLEHGLKARTMALNARDSQLIESRDFSIRDVANWFNIPPHKLGDTTRTSFSSLEQENQSYLDEALDGWLVNIEQECRDKLLTQQQKRSDSHLIEFNRAALIRADMSARGEFYTKALGGSPWMTMDEIRSRENLNALPDGVGSTLRVPLNMADADSDEAAPEPDEGDDDMRDALRASVAASAKRALVRLERIAEQKQKRAGFNTWLHDEMRSAFAENFRENIEPAVRAASVSLGKEYTPDVAADELLQRAYEALSLGDPLEGMATAFANEITE